MPELWTWCPHCGDRYDHVVEADNSLICKHCGKKNGVAKPKPKETQNG